jgi:hypothetical protein
MTDDTQRRLAVLIDADNAQPSITEGLLAEVFVSDFRKNPRGELGTRTATLHREGIEKLRRNWTYTPNNV